MSDNDEIYSKYFGDSLQLTNRVLDSGAMVSYDTSGFGFYPRVIMIYK